MPSETQYRDNEGVVVRINCEAAARWRLARTVQCPVLQASPECTVQRLPAASAAQGKLQASGQDGTASSEYWRGRLDRKRWHRVTTTRVKGVHVPPLP